MQDEPQVQACPCYLTDGCKKQALVAKGYKLGGEQDVQIGPSLVGKVGRHLSLWPPQVKGREGPRGEPTEIQTSLGEELGTAGDVAGNGGLCLSWVL